MTEAEVNANGLRQYTPEYPHAADEEQVRVCTEFLQRCQRTQANRLTWRNSVYSYGLKHHIEQWARKRDMGYYVSNGAAIVAALRLGLAVQPADSGPNAWIGVTRSSVYELFCGVGIQ